MGITKEHQELKKQLQQLRPGSTAAETRSMIKALCAEHGYNPIMELIEIIDNSKSSAKKELINIAGSELVKSAKLREALLEVAEKIIPPDVKDLISIHKEVLQYISPKLKAVEVRGKHDMNINITIQKFGEEVNMEENDDGSFSKKS